MIEPAWIAEARKHIGQAEVPGKGSNPFIASLWIGARSVFDVLGADDSSAPWCGQFVAHCLRTAGLPVVKDTYRAKAWLDCGIALPTALYGCIVVYTRIGGGHVGFVVGRDGGGRPLTLGGNQGDRVSIAPFDPARVAGYRWPGLAMPVLGPLPQLAANGMPSSTNEA